jgi:acetyl-CoA carboxylase biotin carboxylase subunit
MVGKLIVHAETRSEAIARMRGALEEMRIGPIRTTVPFQRRLMDNQHFVDADFDVNYVERLLKD